MLLLPIMYMDFPANTTAWDHCSLNCGWQIYCYEYIQPIWNCSWMRILWIFRYEPLLLIDLHIKCRLKYNGDAIENVSARSISYNWCSKHWFWIYIRNWVNKFSLWQHCHWFFWYNKENLHNKSNISEASFLQRCGPLQFEQIDGIALVGSAWRTIGRCPHQTAIYGQGFVWIRRTILNVKMSKHSTDNVCI